MHYLFKKSEKISPDNLDEAIQQAIEIEIATIPTYLYTYYSINREPDQAAIISSLSKSLIDAGKSFEEAEKLAKEYSAIVMVFANLTGATIMSVAIEEMLHMALSSNLKQAVAGLPKLYGRSPAAWPASLPGHEPSFPIHLSPLSQDQLVTFLKIESPYPLDNENLLQAPPFEYRTIGEFYNEIKAVILDPKNKINFKDAPQLAPKKGYYAQNNIDTVYYDKEHKPHFVNSSNSGDLILINSRASAADAIDVIIDQGEGSSGPKVPIKDILKNCNCDSNSSSEYLKKITSERENRRKKGMEELPHYDKFAELYCLHEIIDCEFKTLGIGYINIYDYFVQNVPQDPTTAKYPVEVQPVSTLINAVYTYIFVMTEGCYMNDGHTQYEIFMFGIHKSMIFILNSLCGDIMKLSYKNQFNSISRVAPTFENYVFDTKSSPKSQLISLYNAALAVYPGLSYLGNRFQDLPDVAL